MRVAICDKCYFDEDKLTLAAWRLRIENKEHTRRLTAHLCEEHFRELKEKMPNVAIQDYLKWIGYTFSLKRYIEQMAVAT